MPDITASIRTLTLADATVSGLVATRMYSDVLPQSATMPAITYSMITETPYEHLAGIVSVSQATIQVDCFGATRSSANALADAVRLQLEKYRGVVGTQQILEINHTSARDGYDRAESGTDQLRFIRSLDFDIHYRTTTS